jgi:hypothetical protein
LLIPGTTNCEILVQHRLYALGLRFEQKATKETKRIIVQESVGRVKAAAFLLTIPTPCPVWPQLRFFVAFVSFCSRALLHGARPAARSWSKSGMLSVSGNRELTEETKR